MQCPYILNGKVRPSFILFGDDKVSLKTSVESVEPSFDNPPVIHQDEFPTLAKKRANFCYTSKVSRAPSLIQFLSHSGFKSGVEWIAPESLIVYREVL